MHIKPLLFGRIARVLVGIGTFFVIWFIGPQKLTMIGSLALVFLGVSFIVGGITGNPGCEITAIPNLFFPNDKQLHCS